MRRLADVLEAVSGTTSKLQKIDLLAAYLQSLNDEELRAGIQWAMAEPWVDENTRSLLREASMALDPARSGERQ